MNTTQMLVSKTTGCVASPRPKSALVPCAPAANGIDGNDIGGRYLGASWLAARKSMTVPTFHDRWPLCSTT